MTTSDSSATLKSWLGMNIPKLTDNNYRIWKELVTEVLLARDLMGYVNGDITEPDETEESDDKTQLKKWQQGNATASALIKGALSEGQLNHVVSIRNAKTAWDTLKTIHEADNRARIQSLLAEFIRFRVDTTIDEGASRLNRIQQEISNLDEKAKPSDDIKTETLLCGLKPEYDSVQVALDTAERGTFEEVVAKLRKAESRLKHRSNAENGHDTALVAKDNKDKQKGQQNKRKPFKGNCYNCGKPGHLKRECKAPPKQGSGSPNDSEQRAQLAEVKGSLTAEGETVTAWSVQTEAEAMQALEGLWCLDSGATAYMIYMREVFTEISPVEEETVVVVNEKKIKI